MVLVKKKKDKPVLPLVVLADRDDVGPDELAGYKRLFQEMDTDKDGRLDRAELRAAMRRRVPVVSEQVVEEIFDEADCDTRGELSWHEFVNCMLKFKPGHSAEGPIKSGVLWLRREGVRSRMTEDQLRFYRDAFCTMDASLRGSVTAEQLLELLQFMGIETNMRAVRLMVKAADTNGDGQLDFDEFLEMIARKDNGDGLIKTSTLAVWKQWLREEIEAKTKLIETQEAADHTRRTRVDLAMQVVRDALSKEQLEHFRLKWEELDLLRTGRVTAKELAAGLVKEGGLAPKEARKCSAKLIAQYSLEADPKLLSWESFVHAMAVKAPGLHHWWRGDKIVKLRAAFDAGGGLGLLGEMAQQQSADRNIAENEPSRGRKGSKASPAASSRRFSVSSTPSHSAGHHHQLVEPIAPSPRRLPPLEQPPNAVQNELPHRRQEEARLDDDDDDFTELSPRSELVSKVRDFITDLNDRVLEQSAATLTHLQHEAGTVSNLFLGATLDARSGYLYGKEFAPGPPLLSAAQDADASRAEDAEEARVGEKMAQDFVFAMAYQRHRAYLPCPVKTLTQHLTLLGWPAESAWTATIDRLSAQGTIFASRDAATNRPFEVYL